MSRRRATSPCWSRDFSRQADPYTVSENPPCDILPLKLRDERRDEHSVLCPPAHASASAVLLNWCYPAKGDIRFHRKHDFRNRKGTIASMAQSLGMSTGMEQTLNPKMIAFYALLQQPLTELEQAIDTELQDNPAL